MSGLIQVSEADRLLQKCVTLTLPVRCPLDKAAGRVLREAIRADRDLPPFDRCMLDGYAVRAAEAQANAIFEVVAHVHAGEATQPLPREAFSAVEVMTGSMLPPGADAIIPYEETEPAGENCFCFQSQEPLIAGDGVHPQASDYRRGTQLLPSGSVLGPVEIGIVASCGYAEPLCSRQPRIAVFGTGDELVPVSSTPAPQQIRESNLHAIENALALAGFHADKIERLSDDAADASILAAALETNDVLIISGAISKGRRDWIPGALATLSQKVFHGVAQRPGKPMGFWKKSNGPAIFGLPGNPVSTLVATHRYVIPYLQACIGAAPLNRRQLALAEGYSFAKPMTLFLPVSPDGAGRAVPCPANNSGDYARLAGSTGFVELPAEQSDWTPGEILTYIPWQR